MCVCFVSLHCFTCIKVLAVKTFILRGCSWLKQQGMWPLVSFLCGCIHLLREHIQECDVLECARG